MKTMTITYPDDVKLSVTDVLNLIEPGAGGHTLLYILSDEEITTQHARLGVTITTTNRDH